MAINEQQASREDSEEEEYPAALQSRPFCNNFFRISKFYQQKSKIAALAVLSCRLLLPLILLLKALPTPEQIQIPPRLQQLLADYSLPLYTLITFNKFLIAATLYTLYREAFFQNTLAAEVIRVFRTRLRALIEIDYHASMFLLSSGIVANLPNFLLSAGVYGFSCIYLENYVNKEDLFYCSSCRASIFFRVLTTAGYLIAAFLTADVSNAGGLKVAISLYIVLMIGWFYRYGSQLYPSEVMAKGMTAFMSLLIAANLLIVEKEFSGGSLSLYAYIVKVVLSFTVILSASQLIIQQKSEFRSSKQSYHSSDIKAIFNDAFVNECSAEKMAFIYARIQMHQEQCENLSCELHSFDLYSQKISSSAENWGVCRILKSYFRCLYEGQLQREPSDGLLIEFLEYLYSERNPNQYKMTMILSRIDPETLDIFDRSSVYELRRSIERLFKNKMKELYEGRLHFEETLEFDQHCREIEKAINYLVRSNMRIYKHLEQIEIDLNVVFGIIRDNLNIEKSLGKEWLTVSGNLKHQKQLTIAYFHYKQLIKNERLTRKDVLLMNLDELNTLKDQSIFLNEGNYFNPAILLHKETMIFTCTLLNERLLFKEVNYNFQFYLGYNREELVQSSLDQIFSEDLKAVHQASFNAWMDCNYKSSFERECFQFKKTECLTREKEVLPVLKYFKSYLNSSSELEFVCMLKVNRKAPPGASHQITELCQSIEQVAGQKQSKISLKFKQSQNLLEFSNQQAIFIKDKQFQPNSKSNDITRMKILMAVFFFLISVSLIAFHVLTVSDAAKLEDYSQQYITFMQCYRFPMILGNSYLQSILGIGNQTKIASQISQWSAAFAGLSSNPIILKTLYDLDINRPADYFPFDSGRLRVNKSLHFDQIELFYLISSSIASLRAPVGAHSQDFINFDQFITPSYDNMINSTKHRFHESFIDYINEIIRSEVIIDIAQFSLAVLFILVMVYQIRLFMVKMKLISDAIVYFKKEDLQKILSYWVQAHQNFREIFGKYTRRYVKRKPKMVVKQIKQKNDNQEQYMNRINKSIIQSKHFINFNRVSIFSIILGTLIIVATLAGTEFSRISRLKYLIYFENEGYLFLRYFPTATIVGYGCLEKYRSLQHQQIPFNPDRYDISLQAMRMVGEFTYIPDVKDQASVYFKKQRNYFFGNPCRYNPAVISSIGVSIATCESIINGSFSRGLTSYMREGFMKADRYIQGKSNLNTSELSEFSQSVSVLSGYILDAISTWGSEFHQNLIDLVTQQTLFTLVNFAVLFAVFLLVFCWFFIGFLQQEYQFYRYMFMKMIPQYVLRVDKVARQTFINFNILE